MAATIVSGLELRVGIFTLQRLQTARMPGCLPTVTQWISGCTAPRTLRLAMVMLLDKPMRQNLPIEDPGPAQPACRTCNPLSYNLEIGLRL